MMLSGLEHRPSARAWARRALQGGAALTAGTMLTAGLVAPAYADELPSQVDGVTMRTFQLHADPGNVCQLRPGTTPNVDELRENIDWSTTDDFGLGNTFITHALANLHIDDDGTYEFKVTNDDGALVYLDDELILENDGPNDSTSVTADVELTAGVHDLRVEHYDGHYSKRLTLEWKKPGDSGFSVIPGGALTTDEEVVRVTAPGYKYCIGAKDLPGDGVQLVDVHPNYDLVNLRPSEGEDAFEPMVARLAFDGDDLIVVETGDVSPGGPVPNPRSADVWRISGVQDAQGPEDVTITKIAEKLHNPLGVEVVDGEIYLSERDRLIKLIDEDEDGMFQEAEEIATWPYGGNFHEFAFGIDYDESDRAFYIALSVAINAGGASTVPNPADGDRGVALRVDLDGEVGENVEYIAGGLRTPNGIGRGPDNDLFIMDNQGGWLPASKLVHVEQDRFFNHFNYGEDGENADMNNPSGMFDNNPVTPPALWIPQNDIGNSPSSPLLLEHGPFEGQVVFGDVTYGGIQRGFLEKVDGEYQGAVFRHIAGLEAGVNEVIYGPDGSLYVGGVGEAGNWSEAGKLDFGLQKLVPNEENAFDMLEMRATEDGFDIEYTQPLSERTIANIEDAYTFTQWHYLARPNYGGPKIDEQPAPVQSVSVSEDRKTVSVSIDSLKPGYVVHVRSPRPFTSDSGEELWNTEAWYTLNNIPGQDSPGGKDFYQAEHATVRGSANIATEHGGFTGTGFLEGLNSPGAAARFDVDVPEAGDYDITVRYASGIHPHDEFKDKYMTVKVNGEEEEGLWTFPTTNSWKAWGTLTEELNLDAGVNTVEFLVADEDQGHINLDSLAVGDSIETCEALTADENYEMLFDGTIESFEEWMMAGDGAFGRTMDCSLLTYGGMGLLWHPDKIEGDYSLKLDWRMNGDDNGGVFIGFPSPGGTIDEPGDPWIAVDQGYEIQIDATDDDDKTTGAVYDFQGADLNARDAALNPVGFWNSYDIRVEGDNIKVYLNDVLVNDFDSDHPDRDLSEGFIGIQNHGGNERVWYKNIQIADLADIDSDVEVTPADPAFNDVDGIANDTYTIPEAEGVQYVVDGEFVEAGEYPAFGEVTISAHALAGYAIAEGAETEWSHTFSLESDDPVHVPVENVSIQMFSLIPWVSDDGLEPVLERLAEIGFENIEPFGGTFGDYSASEFRELVDGLDISVPSSHYNVDEEGFEDTLEFVGTIGQEYVGSGGFAAPGIDTYYETLETANTMNRLGQASVEAEVGKFFGHNHAGEFTTTYEHNGEELSAWEILVQETDPEYVTFQVDVAWAAHAGVDVPELLMEYGDRIELLHIKDATELTEEDGPKFANLGDGEVPLQDILTVAQEIGIEYYVLEFDMAPEGEDFVVTGFEYLTGEEAGGEPDPDPEPERFTDVPEGHNFEDAIYWLAGEGITTGYDDGTFRPKNQITREAMAAFLYRFAGEPEFEAPADSPFTDVSTDHSYYTEITWLAEQEITTGYDDGSFRPGNKITREAMSAFLYRFTEPADYQPGDQQFSDVATSHSFYEEISWLADAEITTGYEDDTFRPKNQITREATAAFLYRLNDLD